MAGWRVVAVKPITLNRSNRLANMYVLSPFVWNDGERFHLLVRAVPRRDDEPRLKMAEIWHGLSSDGYHFDMAIAPTLFPGPDLADLDGCEDPTVVMGETMLRAWYTGYNHKEQTGRLLLARGPDVERLTKAGMALDSTPEFTNPKEATVARAGTDRWRMFFEYAREGASLIGQASAGDLDGPWSDIDQSPIGPRPERWDCWHLSPGPIVGQESSRPTMFYNGATQDAKWRIGWATFDRTLTKLVERCEEPLICPQSMLANGATDIAFAASAVEQDRAILLYFSESDQDMRCATVERI